MPRLRSVALLFLVRFIIFSCFAVQVTDECMKSSICSFQYSGLLELMQEVKGNLICTYTADAAWIRALKLGEGRYSCVSDSALAQIHKPRLHNKSVFINEQETKRQRERDVNPPNPVLCESNSINLIFNYFKMKIILRNRLLRQV